MFVYFMLNWLITVLVSRLSYIILSIATYVTKDKFINDIDKALFRILRILN